MTQTLPLLLFLRSLQIKIDQASFKISVIGNTLGGLGLSTGPILADEALFFYPWAPEMEAVQPACLRGRLVRRRGSASGDGPEPSRHPLCSVAEMAAPVLHPLRARPLALRPG